MDRLKYVKLEKIDGSYSDKIPISVDSDNVEIISTEPVKNLTDYINENNTNINDLKNKEADLSIQVSNNITAIETQKVRIDNIASLEEGSTTGDAELIDARTSWDARSFSSLGDSLRTQFRESKKIDASLIKMMDDKLYNITKIASWRVGRNYISEGNRLKYSKVSTSLTTWGTRYYGHSWLIPLDDAEIEVYEADEYLSISGSSDGATTPITTGQLERVAYLTHEPIELKANKFYSFDVKKVSNETFSNALNIEDYVKIYSLEDKSILRSETGLQGLKPLPIDFLYGGSYITDSGIWKHNDGTNRLSWSAAKYINYLKLKAAPGYECYLYKWDTDIKEDVAFNNYIGPASEQIGYTADEIEVHDCLCSISIKAEDDSTLDLYNIANYFSEFLWLDNINDSYTNYIKTMMPSITANTKYINVLTWNVGNFNFGQSGGHSAEGLDQYIKDLATFISSKEPDLIAITEGGTYIDAAKTINAKDDFWLKLFDDYYSNSGNDHLMQVASQYSLANKNSKKFNNISTAGGANGYTWGTITINDKEIIFCSAHLNWKASDIGGDQYRIEQAEEIINKFANYDNVIIAGDFNSVNLDLYSIFESAGYTKSNGNIWGWQQSFSNPEFPFLDNILVKGDFKIKDFSVIQTELSDHYLLKSRIEILN